MKLREVTKQDKEKIMEMYEEYMLSELIPGIDRFEGIRDFEKLNKMSFNEWIEDLEKNKAEKQCTYYITIEAVDANGARIETDMIYADRLGSGQEIYLKAFEYVEQEKLNQFKNATFRVLEINKYDY